MKLNILAFLVAGFVALQPSLAALKQAPVIDSSYSIFAFTTERSISQNRRVEGLPTLFLVFYKAFENNGKPAICGATVGPDVIGAFPHVERFLNRTKVVAADGTVVRTNISRFTYLPGPETPMELSMLSASGEIVPDYEIIRSYIGQPVNCLSANRRWKQSFASEDLQIELPASVRWDN